MGTFTFLPCPLSSPSLCLTAPGCLLGRLSPPDILPCFPGAQAHREANGNTSVQTPSPSCGTSHLSDASSPTISHFGLLYGHRNRLREITLILPHHSQRISQDCAGTFHPTIHSILRNRNWSEAAACLSSTSSFSFLKTGAGCLRTAIPYPSDFRGLA